MRAIIQHVDTVLDIGCGIRPQNYIVPSVHICCEPLGQYVEHLMGAMRAQREQQCVDRRYVVVQAMWDEAVMLFPHGSVDTVFLTDVVDDPWDVLACRNFHFVDTMGRPFETPKGAFYTIRTMRPRQVGCGRSPRLFVIRPRQRLQAWTGCDRSGDTTSQAVLRSGPCRSH